MNRVALDSSAVLALILQEPGAETVRTALAGSIISTVNSSEVLQKLVEKGLRGDLASTALEQLEIATRDFTQEHAVTAALLRASTRDAGLSLGDRACLALALKEGVPVLTSDRDWLKVDVGVEVQLIR